MKQGESWDIRRRVTKFSKSLVICPCLFEAKTGPTFLDKNSRKQQDGKKRWIWGTKWNVAWGELYWYYKIHRAWGICPWCTFLWEVTERPEQGGGVVCCVIVWNFFSSPLRCVYAAHLSITRQGLSLIRWDGNCCDGVVFARTAGRFYMRDVSRYIQLPHTSLWPHLQRGRRRRCEGQNEGRRRAAKERKKVGVPRLGQEFKVGDLSPAWLGTQSCSGAGRPKHYPPFCLPLVPLIGFNERFNKTALPRSNQTATVRHA